MDIYEKAKELGDLVRNSEEMTRLKDCEARLLGDEEARMLIDEYDLLRKELLISRKSENNKELTMALEDKFRKTEQELFKNDTAKAFLEAKASFDKLVRNINSVIIYSITGELQCSPNKCGSCNKGCRSI